MPLCQRQKKRVAENEMAGWHHWLNGNELGQTPGDSEGQGLQRVGHDWATEREKAMAPHFSTVAWKIPWAPIVYLENSFRFALYVWLLLFSCSVMSNTLQPHGLQHARFLCPSLCPGACSNSCPLSWWCHPAISFSATLISSCSQSFPAEGLFQWVNSSHQVAKVLDFSISPSNEYSGLISFRIDSFDLLAVQGSQDFYSTTVWKHHFFWHSAFFMVQLTFIHDYWKNHSFDYMELCQ